MLTDNKKCEKCGATIPADSEFCQYCGATLSYNNQFSEQPNSLKDESLSVEPQSNWGKDQEQSKKNPKLLTTILIVVTVIAIILAGLNIYQLLGNANNNQVISDYETQIKNKDDQIKKKNDEINSVKSQLSEANKKAGNYDILVSALKNNNYGYASNTFNVNQGIVVLSPGGSKVLTLTAAFDGYVTITSTTDSFNVADVEFNETSWEGDYTTITIRAGSSKGIAKITLNTNLYFQPLQILVIVT